MTVVCLRDGWWRSTMRRIGAIFFIKVFISSSDETEERGLSAVTTLSSVLSYSPSSFSSLTRNAFVLLARMLLSTTMLPGETFLLELINNCDFYTSGKKSMSRNRYLSSSCTTDLSTFKLDTLFLNMNLWKTDWRYLFAPNSTLCVLSSDATSTNSLVYALGLSIVNSGLLS